MIETTGTNKREKSEDNKKKRRVRTLENRMY